MLLGVKAVIAESFERIHRSNLVGMGVLPLPVHQRTERPEPGSGRARGPSISRTSRTPAGTPPVKVTATPDDGRAPIVFEVRVRIDTPKERDYYRHGASVQYVLRQLAGGGKAPSKAKAKPQVQGQVQGKKDSRRPQAGQQGCGCQTGCPQGRGQTGAPGGRPQACDTPRGAAPRQVTGQGPRGRRTHATRVRSPVLVLLDLDGTITRRDTLIGYVTGFALRHPLRLPGFIRVLPALFAFLLGHRDLGRLKGALIHSVMGGASRAEVIEWTSRYVPRLLASGIFAEAARVHRPSPRGG
jgi:hypothetical protein